RLAAPCQVDNAAVAIAAMHALRARLGWEPNAIADGVRNAHVAARLQRLRKPGAAELVIDVAHNPQAARALAEGLRSDRGDRRTRAGFAALADKAVAGIAAALSQSIERWFVGGLAGETPRGLDAAQLRARMPAAIAASTHADVAAALDAAAAAARAPDRIVAFGSFFVAAAALNWAQRNAYRPAE